jgi:hypothetical protein
MRTRCSDPPAGVPPAAGSGSDLSRAAAVGTLVHDGSASPVPPSYHGYHLENWPLQDSITLGALAGAVPSARAHVRHLLWEWRQARLDEDAGIVVTELVANACAASAGLGRGVAPVLVWLGSDHHGVLVAVADASPRCPVQLKLSLDAERGRGLALVEAFSNRWGWHACPAAGLASTMAGLAKVVWAEWRQPSAVRPDRGRAR